MIRENLNKPSSKERTKLVELVTEVSNIIAKYPTDMRVSVLMSMLNSDIDSSSKEVALAICYAMLDVADMHLRELDKRVVQ